MTRVHVVGLDFTTGSYTHSIRFENLKMERINADATAGSGLPLADYLLNIQMGSTGLITGPTSPGAAVLQSDYQFKYDGSKSIGQHILRYGVDFNRIVAAGFVPTNLP